MTKRCYYEVLGVSKSCSIEDIKGAYRKLAKEIHPDTNPGDATAEGKIKEINEAYQILKDEQKRAAYDRYGFAAFENGHGNPRGGFDFSGSFADVFDDLFGDFMGGGARRPGPGQGQARAQGNRNRVNRGADLRYDLKITLEDAFRGRNVELRVPSAVSCETCNGTGAKPGTKPETCGACSGGGKVRASHGFFTIERTCPQCKGRGAVVRETCKTCHGAGQINKERTLSVDIPAGVEEGTRIRLSGEGHAGMGGGPAGDLYIFLSIAAHPLFQRDGHDLHCFVPISLAVAALGGSIEVPLLGGGKETIKIPEGTQGGKQFRLRGRGMPVLRQGVSGDLFVEVKVETPTKLSKKQKSLLHAFAEEAGGSQPECDSFLAKVKDWLASPAS